MTIPVDDPLEKIFQKLEQESEKRARDEAANDLGQIVESRVEHDDDDLTPGASVANDTPSVTVSMPVAEVGTSSRATRDRRRGSVSISVFGQPSEASIIENGSNGSLPPPPLSPLANAASKSTFYHSLVNPKSADTLISESEEENHAEEDDEHVTRMQTIAARQTSISRTVGRVGSLLSRNSRARSSTLPPTDNPSVEIGVSVEEKQATGEVAGSEDESGRATAYADRTKQKLRSRASTSWLSVPSSMAPRSLATKARDFTQKFRRKSKSADVSSSEEVS